MATTTMVVQAGGSVSGVGYLFGIVIGLLVWYAILSAIVRSADANRVWVARGVWVMIGLLVLGNLAESTPGNAVDATAAPALTAGLFIALVVSYPILKRLSAA